MKCRNLAISSFSRYYPVSGFTLVELLVTIGVIAILAVLLTASISYGSARAKVTRCTNNFRQLGIAVHLYEADEKGGRLPSYMLMTISSQLTNYGSIEPYFVDFMMITSLETHGVSPSMYFCPTRGRWKDAEDFYKSKSGGKGIQTCADLVAYYRHQGASMAFLDMFWWIPRPLEGLPDPKFPDPKLLDTRIPDPWPTKTEDSSASIQPIASDWLLGGWDNGRRVVTSASGGHTFRGKIRSNNALFADGHVETRPFSAVRWQCLNNKKETAYMY